MAPFLGGKGTSNGRSRRTTPDVPSLNSSMTSGVEPGVEGLGVTPRGGVEYKYRGING